jgi:hypothetical protein
VRAELRHSHFLAFYLLTKQEPRAGKGRTVLGLSGGASPSPAAMAGWGRPPWSPGTAWLRRGVRLKARPARGQPGLLLQGEGDAQKRRAPRRSAEALSKSKKLLYCAEGAACRLKGALRGFAAALVGTGGVETNSRAALQFARWARTPTPELRQGQGCRAARAGRTQARRPRPLSGR